MSGSAAIKFKNLTIAALPSNMPSSMLMSMTCAPFSTCCLATDKASSNLSSKINLANFLLPVTLVLSPIFIKLVSLVWVSGSSPLNLK